MLVTQDMPLRLKAAAVGLTADEYHALDVVSTGWTGMADVAVSSSDVDALFREGVIDLDAARELPCHTGLRLTGGGSAALGRVTADKRVRIVRGDREAFGLHGRSAEQRVALDLLLDPEVGIVSLGGRAGTGKSALALCAGLEAVMERQQHRKVVVFRPLYAVGGQELGYLPGSESEKMAPWAQAVFDTLGALVSQHVVEEVIARGMLEVLPLTHIRGRSLHDSFVIVDEAQSLERGVLLTVLSRLGTASRVVLTHDVAQRDNLRVGRHDGVAAVIEKLKGHPLFAHVTLTRSERSPIAALVTEMLEGPAALTPCASPRAGRRILRDVACCRPPTVCGAARLQAVRRALGEARHRLDADDGAFGQLAEGAGADVGGRAAHTAQMASRTSSTPGRARIQQLSGRRDALLEQGFPGAVELAVAARACAHRPLARHPERLLVRPSGLVAEQVAGRLVGARQPRADHHGGRARGQRQRHVAGMAHAAVGPHLHAQLAPGGRALGHGRELRPSDPGHHPGGAHRAGPDADLDDVRARRGQVAHAFRGDDVARGHRHVRARHRADGGQRVEHLVLVAVRGVDDQHVHARVEQRLRLDRDVAVDRRWPRRCEPARGVERRGVDPGAQGAERVSRPASLPSASRPSATPRPPAPRTRPAAGCRPAARRQRGQATSASR